MLTIEAKPLEVMQQDAIATFPDECCGFFFGTETDNEKKIVHAMIVTNAKEGDKRRRFQITAKDYMKAEDFAELNGVQLLGVYHSHPAHPAFPSETDRVAAQPHFSYLIISIFDKKVADLRSWVLNDGLQFEEEKLELLN